MAQILETKADEATGRDYLVYDDGTTKWKDTGHFRTNNPRYALTPARGRELAERSKQAARQRAIEAIDEAAIEAGQIPSISQVGSGEGWKAVIKHVAKTLFETKSLNRQADTGNFLAKVTGYAAEEESPERIVDAIARLFVNFAERSTPSETVEGKVIE